MIPDCLFGNIAVPDKKILRERDIGPEYHECESQFSEIVIMFDRDFILQNIIILEIDNLQELEMPVLTDVAPEKI